MARERAVPLLHLGYDLVLEGRVSLALESSASLLADAGSLSSPPVVQGDAARIAAHVRNWSQDRRGVVLTSTPGAIDRMAEQLRGEGLEVTTDPAHVLEARLSVLESTLPAGFFLESPPDRRVERERSHRSA